MCFVQILCIFDKFTPYIAIVKFITHLNKLENFYKHQILRQFSPNFARNLMFLEYAVAGFSHAYAFTFSGDGTSPLGCPSIFIFVNGQSERLPPTVNLYFFVGAGSPRPFGFTFFWEGKPLPYSKSLGLFVITNYALIICAPVGLSFAERHKAVPYGKSH